MPQITDKVIMVRPKHFGFNPETADDNVFQSSEGNRTKATISELAIVEFDKMVQTLRDSGVMVDVWEDSNMPGKPDAVFPNNWFSTHQDGSLITYPMYSPLRRLERDPEILEFITSKYDVSRSYSFEQFEEKDRFLEGTGSMVLDRDNKIVYACLSERTDITTLDQWCILRGYRKVVFHALAEGEPVYHTNVVMALGDSFVVICMESIDDPEERDALYHSFDVTDKEVVEISLRQMFSFAGNMLQLKTISGGSILVMSSTARDSLKSKQVRALEKHATIVTADIDVIEQYGGGSVRCMIAENFLPIKD